MGRRTSGRVFIILIISLSSISHAAIRPLTGLTEVFYERPGDITLGIVIPVHRYDSHSFCSSRIREMGALQRVEAVSFAVDEINKRTDLLPNITLGFTMMDDCSKDTTALARALHLIQVPSNSSDQMKPINVIGLIGSESSKNSVQLADLLSLFKIPTLSYISTSPLLSNKNVYPYFSRIVPSDTLQAKVIGDILGKFGWSYVSIIYAEGSYGSEGYKAVKARLEDIGFCLAVIREMRQSFSDEDYDNIIRELQQKPRAKVVVIFAPLAQTRSLLTSAKRNNAHGQFTWIGSDAWGRNIQDYSDLEEVAEGAITVKFFSHPTPRFDVYFKHLTSRNASDNPWFKEAVESELGCSFVDSESMPLCSEDFSFGYLGTYRSEITVSLVIDAVYSYARAMDAVLQNCNNENVLECFTSEDIFRQLRNLSFHGENGMVSFDENGDGKATYDVQNLQLIDGSYSLSSIAQWDSYNELFTRFDEDGIRWKSTVLSEGESSPTSTCSDPCPIGYQAVRTQPHCCWYCQKCRNNEKTVIEEGLPQCKMCPTNSNYTWPDEETRTSCLPIEHTFTSIYDFTGIVIVGVDVFTILVATLVTSLFIKNNKEKLIKASSRELSYLMLAGIFLSCLFVALLAIRPNDFTCNITYIGFHLSFTLTYAPLTVKTNRVYRIFTAGKKSNKRPAFIDSKYQILFSALILISQTLIIGIWIVIDTPRARTVMPSFSERYVEVTCELPETGFLVSVICNLTLVLVCTFYAIKTRKLPDNFNESRFVSFCVYTTIVLWLAFIPTYFTTSKTTLRSLFLAAAMVANSNVTLFFLYIPKLYALYYVSAEAQHLGTSVPRPGTNNQVGPSRS